MRLNRRTASIATAATVVVLAGVVTATRAFADEAPAPVPAVTSPAPAASPAPTSSAAPAETSAPAESPAAGPVPAE
ncbi:hypothetical protein AB0C29_32510, partial [Actinoplanes sp. NPDC048791]|uniref:hypothetical protein n=1 Tax=Actinoplanes sp. NPDC048791 TaxID=3154623 RepID=UPI0033EAFEDF